MEVRKAVMKACSAHSRPLVKPIPGCTDCLTETVLSLCDYIETHNGITPEVQHEYVVGLQEVFQGTTVAHFTDDYAMNVVALPVSPADHEDGTVRYTVEFRKTHD